MHTIMFVWATLITLLSRISFILCRILLSCIACCCIAWHAIIFNVLSREVFNVHARKVTLRMSLANVLTGMNARQT